MLNPGHHCLLLELLLKHPFSRALIHPYEVFHIVID